MSESQEERLKQLRLRLAQRARLFRKLVDEFGPRVLDIAREDIIDDAITQYEHMDLPRRDLQAVIDLVWTPAGNEVDYMIEEQTPTHMKMKVTRCVWADEWRKLGAEDIGDVFQCCWDYGFCEGLNPTMQFTRTKTLMQGDDCCDHTYDLKVES